ncbi:MAG: M20/M25/M40 family metallo-hydrolase [Bacteroidota bacterium]
MPGVCSRWLWLISFSFTFVSAFAQKKGKHDLFTLQLLEKHVKLLADDRMQGRRAGTFGADLARDYIKDRFEEYGLAPGAIGSEWVQTFSIYEGKEADSSCLLIMDGEQLTQGIDYFPLPWSKNGSIEAVASPALFESWSPWMIDLVKLREGQENNPHFDITKAIREKEKQATGKGSTALIFYNNHLLSEPITFNRYDTSAGSSIPIIILNQRISEEIAVDIYYTWDVQLKVEMRDRVRLTSNVVGYLNNEAPSTVVIGAHYDHLGYGEDHNSRYTGEPVVHNGADDNASGTAALIELARLLKKNGNKSFNYLFVAFSAEELGLHGSKYFTENLSVPLSEINYMINLDMIGRLNDSTRTLTIGGVGTSPSWGQLIYAEKKLPFKIKTDSSGTGPSDHTSFYRKGIPVLFFFTGLHNDYHRPEDDPEKINYKGQLDIVNYICRLINRSSKEERLVFTKTREQATTTGARFSVSLGIMPDYTYTGMGVKADGISTDKPAEKAGILTGDIIISLDQHEVSSLEAYMKILSQYKKGDPAQVKVKRGENELIFSIVF